MKPTPTKPPRMSKGRVMYHSDCVNPFAGMRQDKNEFYDKPVAVLPCRTAREAKQIVKAHNRQTP